MIVNDYKTKQTDITIALGRFSFNDVCLLFVCSSVVYAAHLFGKNVCLCPSVRPPESLSLYRNGMLDRAFKLSYG